MKQAVLIALGDELLSGVRREGNCGWLANRLALAGWKVLRMEIIPDGLGVLEDTLALWAGKTDLIVISGGLGPTHDDCTRKALARFLNAPLQVNAEAYNKILARYPSEMRENLELCRISQGSVPEGAQAIHNPCGSALGISFLMEGTKICAFPGVPDEFKAMAEQELAFEMSVSDCRMRSLIVVGWPESLLKDRIAPVVDDPSLHISILPSSGTVEIILRGEPVRIECAARTLRELLPGDCLPEGCFSVAEDLLREARKRNVTLAFAESCTGGLLGAALTDISGSSDVFLGSAVCYSNSAKKHILSVSGDLLESFGAVSSECAISMAKGALNQFGSELALSVTGVAGPGGGSEEKPVGTVWFALAGLCGERAFLHHFPGDRLQIRRSAMNTGLLLLRKTVMELNML
ncbi:MAG: competence protein [Synergistetes bacterium HGW-Synergistetes-2]|jgi:nicotinamide-nucleotide amidase|nr:MAG: competence protein [Synergistetes bacterium HGW-Synergistetes-2]